MRLLGTKSSRTAGSSLLIVIMLLLPCFGQPSTSTEDISSGYTRLRQRAHRRRHKQRQPVDELAELLEMKATEEEIAHPRALKNAARRERNEELCKTERRSVELNSDQYEFDPPFIVEVRCKNVHDYETGVTASLKDQSCIHDLLRCVQRYSEVQTVRRPVHSTHWHPHLLRSVPSGCECMWPVDKYGHQDL